MQKRLRRNVGEAIADFNMIEKAIALWFAFLAVKIAIRCWKFYANLQQSAPINFSLVAVNLDQKQPGFPEHILPAYLEQLGVEYKIVEENTYGIVKEKNPGRKNHLLAVLSSASRYSVSYSDRTGRH
ncbi:tRNA(Cytosine32)-2-thiocytidine synthetase [Salmonella bongori]|nr:tRNA(Cytosine32)-2-thiocytidine synthetase [Salmonella bongori]